MKRTQLLLAAAGALFFSLTIAPTAAADGIIVPEPPPCTSDICPDPFPIRQFAIENHDVEVQIEGGVATTRIDQTFRNDNGVALEGTYIFPLPPQAAISDFRLWIDGEPVEGELLTREEARRRYEAIVARLKDPALLEYIDGGAFQASVFPINPGETRRLQITYSEVLSQEGNLVTYRYPLNTEKFSVEPLERVAISVRAEVGAQPQAIYSPTHQIAVDRIGSESFRASYEDSEVLPDRDFVLHYSLADEDIGIHLMSFRNPATGAGAGTFLLLAAPGIEPEDRGPVAKDVILVLDQSGSMDGPKFEQAQEAAGYILENLNARDRFGLIAFSTGTRIFERELADASEGSRARRWLAGLSARGATDINRALLEAVAMASAERPTYVLFLTDGLPTEGVTDSDRILANLLAAAGDSLRLFAFGVGYDVDTYLLDSLAGEHSGASAYVTPDQRIDETISGLYAKLDAPMLTDVEIDFEGPVLFDQYPSQLPDLFAGSQLVVVGRYREPGQVELTLRGRVDGRQVEIEYGPFELRAEGGEQYLPRLWATRKIGALLRQIRLEGPEEELIDQVIALSVRYGVVTPYTSYLVTDSKSLTEEGRSELAADVMEQMTATPPMVSGEEAVERAAAESEIARAETAGSVGGSAGQVVRWVGDRTFRLTDGIWIDTAFDPERQSALQVTFLSPAYFELVDRHQVLAEAFALGPQVIAVVGDQAYQVVRQDGLSEPERLPTPPAMDPNGSSMPTSRQPASSDPAEWEGERPQEDALPCSGPGLLVGLGMVAALHRKSRN